MQMGWNASGKKSHQQLNLLLGTADVHSLSTEYWAHLKGICRGRMLKYTQICSGRAGTSDRLVLTLFSRHHDLPLSLPKRIPKFCLLMSALLAASAAFYYGKFFHHQRPVKGLQWYGTDWLFNLWGVSGSAKETFLRPYFAAIAKCLCWLPLQIIFKITYQQEKYREATNTTSLASPQAGSCNVER